MMIIMKCRRMAQIGLLALNSGGKITMRRSSVAVMGRNSCGITAANGASIDGEQVNLLYFWRKWAAAAATLDLTSVIDLSDSTMETAASGSPCVISAGKYLSYGSFGNSPEEFWRCGIAGRCSKFEKFQYGFSWRCGRETV